MKGSGNIFVQMIYDVCFGSFTHKKGSFLQIALEFSHELFSPNLNLKVLKPSKFQLSI